MMKDDVTETSDQFADRIANEFGYGECNWLRKMVAERDAATRRDALEGAAKIAEGCPGEHGWNYHSPTMVREVAERIRAAQQQAALPCRLDALTAQLARAEAERARVNQACNGELEAAARQILELERKLREAEERAKTAYARGLGEDRDYG